MKNLREQLAGKNIRAKLYLCLEFTKKNKDCITKIGVAWVDNDQFIFNKQIFSDFIDEKKDTVKHHLADHGFTYSELKKSVKSKYSTKLGIQSELPGRWAVRSHKHFNLDSSMDDVLYLEFIKNKNCKLSQNKTGPNDIPQNNDDCEINGKKIFDFGDNKDESEYVDWDISELWASDYN